MADEKKPIAGNAALLAALTSLALAATHYLTSKDPKKVAEAAMAQTTIPAISSTGTQVERLTGALIDLQIRAEKSARQNAEIWQELTALRRLAEMRGGRQRAEEIKRLPARAFGPEPAEAPVPLVPKFVKADLAPE